MKRHLILMCCLLLSPLGALANDFKYVTEGMNAEKKGHYHAAILLYTKAINGEMSDESRSIAFVSRALAYLHQKNYDYSISDYTDAMRLDPKNAVYIFGRGIAYYDKGDYEMAIKDYSLVLEFDPNDSAFFYNRGVVYFFQEQFQNATDDFNTVVSLEDPSNDQEIHIWRYLAYARAGQDDTETLNTAAMALKDHTWPSPVMELFLGKLSPDDLELAIKNSGAKFKKDHQCETHAFLGEFALLKNDFNIAYAEFHKALDHCPESSRVYRDLAAVEIRHFAHDSTMKSDVIYK